MKLILCGSACSSADSASSLWSLGQSRDRGELSPSRAKAEHTGPWRQPPAQPQLCRIGAASSSAATELAAAPAAGGTAGGCWQGLQQLPPPCCSSPLPQPGAALAPLPTPRAWAWLGDSTGRGFPHPHRIPSAGPAPGSSPAGPWGPLSLSGCAQEQPWPEPAAAELGAGRLTRAT